MTEPCTGRFETVVLQWCSALGRWSRPLAIDFLGLSGSWELDPLQTLPQTVFAERTLQKHKAFANKRIKNSGTKTVIIRRNLVKYEVSETIGSPNPSKRFTGRGLRDQRPAHNHFS